MDGIINVLKPPGMTSSDVVMWLRKLLQTKKVGHTGTLDPGVAGVLPICIGKGTRLAEYLTEQGKSYRAEITFGVTTDTQDSFGKTLRSTEPNINEDDFQRIFSDFLGRIKQVPPMFSAVRHQGKHLYDYARQGLVLERTAKEIEVYELALINWRADKFPRALFDIKCSKGTYVRTLCHDMGNVLSCGAHMSYLLRLSSGPFRLADSWTLEEIQAAVEMGDYSFLSPIHEILDLPKVSLTEKRLEAFKHGLSTAGEQVECELKAENTFVQVIKGTELIGIGVWRQGDLHPHKVLG